MVRQAVPSKLAMLRMPRPELSRFRYVNRKMVNRQTNGYYADGHAGVSHMDGVFSLIFADDRNMLLFAAGAASVCLDFSIRTAGKSNLRHDVVQFIPVLSGRCEQALINRQLRLASVTCHYGTLWRTSHHPFHLTAS